VVLDRQVAATCPVLYPPQAIVERDDVLDDFTAVGQHHGATMIVAGR